MDLKTYLNQFLFGYYPYVCLAVFFIGSLIRFDREQYTWKSDSSQFLRYGQLRWASNLFHIGVLGMRQPTHEALLFRVLLAFSSRCFLLRRSGRRLLGCALREQRAGGAG